MYCLRTQRPFLCAAHQPPFAGAAKPTVPSGPPRHMACIPPTPPPPALWPSRPRRLVQRWHPRARQVLPPAARHQLAAAQSRPRRSHSRGLAVDHRDHAGSAQPGHCGAAAQRDGAAAVGRPGALAQRCEALMAKCHFTSQNQLAWADWVSHLVNRTTFLPCVAGTGYCNTQPTGLTCQRPHLLLSMVLRGDLPQHPAAGPRPAVLHRPRCAVWQGRRRSVGLQRSSSGRRQRGAVQSLHDCGPALHLPRRLHHSALLPQFCSSAAVGRCLGYGRRARCGGSLMPVVWTGPAAAIAALASAPQRSLSAAGTTTGSTP